MNRPKEQVGKNANTVADASQLSDPRNFGKADVNNSAQDSLFTSFVLWADTVSVVLDEHSL